MTEENKDSDKILKYREEIEINGGYVDLFSLAPNYACVMITYVDEDGKHSWIDARFKKGVWTFSKGRPSSEAVERELDLSR